MDLRVELTSLKIQARSLGDRWDALHQPEHERADWGLTLPSESHRRLFDRAFPELAKNDWKVNAKVCATFFRRITDEDLDSVRRFIEAIRQCVVIGDLTQGSMALGYRAKPNAAGNLEPTDLGQLMRAAKPYNEPPTKQHHKAGQILAHRLCEFVSSVPSFRYVDGFVPVPPSNPRKEFSLPRGFVYLLAKHTGKLDLREAVRKSRITRELKNLPHKQKVEELMGSITVDATGVAGKSIVVVDDLYQSGLTLNYVAGELRRAGAKEVFGLAAVKTMRNDDNLPKTAAPMQTDDNLDDEIRF